MVVELPLGMRGGSETDKVTSQVVIVCPDGHEVVEAHTELAPFRIMWVRCVEGDWWRYVRVGKKFDSGTRMAGPPPPEVKSPLSP